MEQPKRTYGFRKRTLGQPSSNNSSGELEISVPSNNLLGGKRKVKEMRMVEDNDSCAVITVEEITRPVCKAEEDTSFIKHLQINLLSHCIFCLRKTSKPRFSEPSIEAAQRNDPSNLQVVSRANLSCFSSPFFLSVFNRTWSYLQKPNIDSEESQDSLLESLISLRDGKSTRFLDVPTMCRHCGAEMEKVYKLFTELKSQLDTLGRIVEESKYFGEHSWRAENFERTLKDSTLEHEVVDSTVDFLGKLGKRSDDIVENELGSESELTSNDLEASSEGHIDNQIFVDENDDDDEWGDSDPDYIKSEHEDDSKEESDDNDDDESWSDRSTLRTRKGKCHNLPAVPMPPGESSEGNMASQSKDSCSEMQSQVQQEIAFIYAVDPETKQAKFTCTVGTCTELFSKWRLLKEHVAQKHNINGTLEYFNFQCGVCDKYFRSLKNMRRHMERTHSNPARSIKSKSQFCEICKAEVPISDIYEHVRAHVGTEYIIPCPSSKCSKVYTNSRSLYAHLNKSKCCRNFIPNFEQVLAAANSSVCNTCGHKATTAMSLRGHLNRMHENPQKNFSCPIKDCTQQFTVKQSVELHIYQHDMRSSFDKQRCAECSGKLKVDLMEAHLRDTHEAKQVIKCYLCPFVFSSRDHLVDHLFAHRHHRDSLSCDICGEDQAKFSKHSDLRLHYFEVHQVGKQYICEHCGFVSLRHQRLTEHTKKQHLNLVPNPKSSKKTKRQLEFKCDDCGVVYKQEFTLRDHKIREHGAEPYACKLCNKTFPVQMLLLRHTRKHKGEAIQEELTCDWEGCGKIFKQRKNLRHHIASTHRGEKPLVCELCGKSYVHKQTLITHVNNVHLGVPVRDHVCDVCGERFAEMQILNRHKLIHTGERPFSCEVCGQRFRQKEVLRRHRKAHDRKGADFKPNGPMKKVRKRVETKSRKDN